MPVQTLPHHLHRLASALAILCALFIAFAAGGCTYFKDWEQLPASHDDERVIYVINHGWHTGIIIARQRLGDELTFIQQQLGDSPYYEFGWGDKDFYQNDGFHIGIALKAVFWVNDATMHIVAVPNTPAAAFPDSKIVELRVSSAGHNKLIHAIADSFAKDANGNANSTRDGLYGRSRFFDANGSYYAFNTCNTWTARALASAGVPTTALTVSAGSVIRQSARAATKYSCCSDSPP